MVDRIFQEHWQGQLRRLGFLQKGTPCVKCGKFFYRENMDDVGQADCLGNHQERWVCWPCMLQPEWPIF